MRNEMKKMISWVLVFAFVIGTFSIHTVTIQAAKTEIWEYTDKIPTENGIIYQTECSGKTNIRYFKASTGKSTTIVTEKKFIIEFLLDGSNLLYTTTDNKNQYATYSISLKGKNKKKEFTGILLYADSSYLVYSRLTTDFMTEVYQKDRTTGKVIKVVKTGDYFDYVKSIGSTLYFYKYDQTSRYIKLLSMKAGDSRLTVVSSDKISEGEAYCIPMIADIVKIQGNLFYQFGTIQGTGRFWYGTLMKIDKDGKKKTVTKEMYDETIYYDKQNIYYDNGYDKYKAYEVKTGKKTSYKLEYTENQSYHINGSKTYRTDVGGKDKICVDRFDSGTEYKHLRKNFIKFTYKKNKKYTYSAGTTKVGDYFLVDVTAIDYNDPSYGWRGNFIGSDWFVADKTGKVIGKLS